LRLCVLLSLPAMIGLMLLAQPITAMLFHSGKFSQIDVINTATVTSAYGLGIVGLVSIKILAPGFFARQDTKTPVKIAIAVLIFTQIANWILVPRIGHSALALSISLGALLNAAWMLIALRKTNAFVPSSGWIAFVLPVLAASFTMAFALSVVEPAINWAELQSTPLKRFGLVSCVIGASAAIYFGTLMLLDIDLESLLRKKTANKKTIS
jgi:putative peptidoglycan lipid II flippase